MMAHLTKWGCSSALYIVIVSTLVKGHFLNLHPEGQEASFTYELIVTTKTEKPSLFGSQFNLTGRVDIHYLEERVIRVQNRDFKFSMYSGEVNGEINVTRQELPKEADFIYNPFEIQFKDGKVSSLKVSINEPVWSISIKKAFASLLQLDVSRIRLNQRHSFTSREDSIQGKCLVRYNVLPSQDEALISKFKTGADCELDSLVWSNIESIQGSDKKPKNHELFYKSEQVYQLKKNEDEGGFTVKSIESFGETFIFITEKSHSTHSITVSQKLTMESMGGIKQAIQVMNQTLEIDSLKFDENEFYLFKFSTNEDITKVTKKVIQLVSLVLAQLTGPDQLTAQENPVQSSLIPLLITYLRKLNVELLHATLSEVRKLQSPLALDLMIKMMPLVGSRESSLFIMDLISKQEVDDLTAVHLLSSLPTNIRQTSIQLLSELQNLILLPDGISRTVKESAVLSFSTLIYRTCKLNGCSEEIMHSYISQFIEIIKDPTVDYGMKLTYLTGIKNIQSQVALEYLIPLATAEEEDIDEDLRSEILETMAKLARDSEKVYETFWPIISNEKESLEIRALAIDLVLNSKPNMSILQQIKSFMDTDSSSDLYNYYFSMLTNACQKQTAKELSSYENACKILKTTKTPISYVTSSVHQSFSFHGDNVYFTGKMSVNSGRLEKLVFDFISTSNGYEINIFTVYIRVRGLQEKYLQKTGIPGLDKLKPIINKIFLYNVNDENLHLELILYSQKQAILTKYYSEKNIDDLTKDVRLILGLREKMEVSFLHVTSAYNLEKFFVTDIGMPGVLSVDLPILTSLELGSNPDVNTTSLNLRQWSQGSSVLKVKNTIVSIWQGIMKSQIMRFNLPVAFKPENEQTKKYIKAITLMSHADDAELGFKWQTNTNLFTVTYDESFDALSLSCKNCKNSMTVFKEKTKNIMFKQLKSTSYNFHSSVFDCESDGNHDSIVSEMKSFSEDVLWSSLRLFVTAGVHLQNTLANLDIPGSCGFAALLIPNKGFQICLGIKEMDQQLQENGSLKTTIDRHEKDFLIFYNTRLEDDFQSEESLKVTITLEELEDNENKHCDLSGDVQEWDCVRPVILDCFSDIKHRPKDGKSLKIVIQVPKIAERLLNSFVDKYYGHYSINQEYTSSSTEKYSEMIVYLRNNSIYFNLESSKKYVLCEDSDIIKLAEEVILNWF